MWSCKSLPVQVDKEAKEHPRLKDNFSPCVQSTQSVAACDLKCNE